MTLLAADIIAKFYAFMWPLARITATLMTVPVLSVEAANARVRLTLAVALAALVFPMFEWPAIDPLSAQGLTALANEVAIGIIIGLTLQIVTSALLLAGQYVSSSMGLSIATLLDPTFGNVPTIAQVMMILGTLIFFALGGHLLLVSILIDSFTMLPVGKSILGLQTIRGLLQWSSMMFLGALMIALPVMAALILINIGLGVVTRAAPSLNIFVVGFPAMITAGFLLTFVSMGSTGDRIQWLWTQGFSRVREILTIGP
jgi:flagellar biosynthetic protein FliR